MPAIAPDAHTGGIYPISQQHLLHWVKKRPDAPQNSDILRWRSGRNQLLDIIRNALGLLDFAVAGDKYRWWTMALRLYCLIWRKLTDRLCQCCIFN